MTRFQIFLPDQMLKRLRALSAKAGIPGAELIRRAVDQYMKEQK